MHFFFFFFIFFLLFWTIPSLRSWSHDNHQGNYCWGPGPQHWPIRAPVNTCDHVWPDVTILQRAIITSKEFIVEFLDLYNDQCDQLWSGVTTCEQLCPNNHQGNTYLAMSRPQVHLMGFPSCLLNSGWKHENLAWPKRPLRRPFLHLEAPGGLKSEKVLSPTPNKIKFCTLYKSLGFLIANCFYPLSAPRGHNMTTPIPCLKTPAPTATLFRLPGVKGFWDPWTYSYSSFGFCLLTTDWPSEI